jgi:hypothetical protein
MITVREKLEKLLLLNNASVVSSYIRRYEDSKKKIGDKNENYRIGKKNIKVIQIAK